MTRALTKTTSGFFGGIAALARGFGFIVATPAMWPLALAPAAIALVVFGVVGALVVWGALALAHQIAQHVGGDGSGALGAMGLWVLEALLCVVAALVAFAVALSLAQPLSGFALERIARAQERSLGGPEWPEQPTLASMLHSLQVTFAALLVGLPLLGTLTIVTVAFPPASVVTLPLKFLVTSLMIAWDLLDYPLSARGMSVGARLRFFGGHLGAVLGFGVAAGLVLLVPGVGLLVLPVGVAGAARLVSAEERLLSLAGGAQRSSALAQRNPMV
jgi:CysZ protein